MQRFHLSNTFIRTPPNFCQAHFAIHDFPEKMRHIFGAYRHKIRPAIIIMPHGTRRWYAVFIAKQIIWHRYNYLLHKYKKSRTDVACNVSPKAQKTPPFSERSFISHFTNSVLSQISALFSEAEHTISSSHHYQHQSHG